MNRIDWDAHWLANDCHVVILSLPGNTRLPVVAGQWRREDGQIIARYTREQLGWAVGMVMAGGCEAEAHTIRPDPLCTLLPQHRAVGELKEE